MPAFGSNRFTIPFLEAVLNREVVVSGDGSEEDPFVYEHVGFRLSDRIVSALDRFLGQVIGRLASVTYPGLGRFAFIYPFIGAVDWAHSMNLADEEEAYTKYGVLWNPGTGTITHNSNGITMTGNATGSTQADCAWNTGEQAENWIYKTFGLYSRTNSTDSSRTLSASKVQGATTYIQGIHCRQPTSNYFHCQHVYYSPGGTMTQAVVSDSLGLFASSREGSLLLRAYKRGVQAAYDTTNAAVGLGSGTGGAVMMINGTRNLSFVFATKHNCFLNNSEFVAFADHVQRFQVGLARAV